MSDRDDLDMLNGPSTGLPCSDPRRRWPVAKVGPHLRAARERALRPLRAEDLDDGAMTAWVTVNPATRGGLSPATQRALAYLDTFASKK